MSVKMKRIKKKKYGNNIIKCFANKEIIINLDPFQRLFTTLILLANKNNSIHFPYFEEEFFFIFCIIPVIILLTI